METADSTKDPVNQWPEVTIYTDGACQRNPGGPGSWGAVLIFGVHEKEISGALDTTTSQRAELIAMIEALKVLNQRCRVTIYCDSQVTVYCASGEYNRNGTLDLWEVFNELDALHQVTYKWVRGHNGDPYNQRAHRLAQRALHPKP